MMLTPQFSTTQIIRDRQDLNRLMAVFVWRGGRINYQPPRERSELIYRTYTMPSAKRRAFTIDDL